MKVLSIKSIKENNNNIYSSNQLGNSQINLKKSKHASDTFSSSKNLISFNGKENELLKLLEEKDKLILNLQKQIEGQIHYREEIVDYYTRLSRELESSIHFYEMQEKFNNAKAILRTKFTIFAKIENNSKDLSQNMQNNSLPNGILITGKNNGHIDSIAKWVADESESNFERIDFTHLNRNEAMKSLDKLAGKLR